MCVVCLCRVRVYMNVDVHMYVLVWLCEEGEVPEFLSACLLCTAVHPAQASTSLALAPDTCACWS